MKLNHCHIIKPKNSRYWQMRWEVAGEKQSSKSLRVRDKRTAEKRMHEFIKEFEQEAIGILPARNLREASEMSLESLLTAYLDDLSAQKCASKYVENTGRYIRKVVTARNWKTIRDISAEGFTAWRSLQRDLAAKSLNQYFGALTSFCNWLVNTERMKENPLRRVSKVKDHDKKRVRRAVSDEEIQKLLEVAPSERRIIYLIALHTGLRRSEIELLEWQDVILVDENPQIHLRCVTTKNRKGETVFLHPELVTALKESKDTSATDDSRVVKMFNKLDLFKKDLAAAGIVYKDAMGRVFDLHAMRVTFNTRLANHSVPTRIAMQAMRHSDEKLTTKVYTDTALLPVAAQVCSLPPLLGSVKVSHILSHGLETEGNSATQRDIEEQAVEELESLQTKGFRSTLTHSEPNCVDSQNGSGGRDRTYDLVINSHPLCR